MATKKKNEGVETYDIMLGKTNTGITTVGKESCDLICDAINAAELFQSAGHKAVGMKVQRASTAE